MNVNWEPFWVETNSLTSPRPINGNLTVRELNLAIGDRLRAAAFAEVQAERGFSWACQKFAAQVEPELIKAWQSLAAEEVKHLNWLLARMQQLDVAITEKPVSDRLWQSLIQAPTPREFCHLMAGAETRGKRAGERLGQSLLKLDPQSAAIFNQIALEETRHIELAYQFYPLN